MDGDRLPSKLTTLVASAPLRIREQGMSRAQRVVRALERVPLLMVFRPRTGSAADSPFAASLSRRALRARLRHVVEQHPLFETQPSRHAMAEAPSSLRPETVFAGIGLVSGPTVTRALPLDVMGLLLSAEQVRRTLAAERLLVLVADAHALCNGAPRTQLDHKTAQYLELLRAVRDRCGFSHMQVVRASEWEHETAYRATLQTVQRKLPASTDPYVLREVADIAHVERVYGGVVKVGWALQRSRRGAHRDERAFDDAFTRFVGGQACFVYAKAGRALDDQRHKVSPYVVSDADRRICIEPGENVAEKLARARNDVSHSTFRGVYNHLKAVTRSYGKLVRPLHGNVSERAQALIEDVLEDRSIAVRFHTRAHAHPARGEAHARQERPSDRAERAS